MKDYCFEVICRLERTFKSFISRFDAILRSNTRPDQHLALIVFMGGMLTTPMPRHDHHVFFDLTLDCIKIYQDAKILISHHLDLQKTKRLCAIASSKQLLTSKKGQLVFLIANRVCLRGNNKDQAFSIHALKQTSHANANPTRVITTGSLPLRLKLT